jgi:hypothetical protein
MREKTMNIKKIERMKECKKCGCYTDEETEICITCQSKQWTNNLNPRDEKKGGSRNEIK